MNKNQRTLYKALEIIATVTLSLESATDVCKELTKDEVQEVLNKISEKFLEYDSDSFYNEAYNYGNYANQIITSIDDKLDSEEVEEKISSSPYPRAIRTKNIKPNKRICCDCNNEIRWTGDYIIAIAKGKYLCNSCERKRKG